MSNLQQQIQVMLTMQDEMNRVVFPDWRERGLAWHRAIYIEAGEFLDHLGTWKWWKKGTPDLAQAQMELVDIWHFGLSLYMDKEKLAPDSPSLISGMMSDVHIAVSDVPNLAQSSVEANRDAIHELVDRMVANAGNRQFHMGAFVGLMAYVGMSFDTLYKQYVGKNMLNRFRQEHGYKTGEYQKTWDGREDNVHLVEILNALPPGQDVKYPALVMQALNERYPVAAVSRPALM